MPISEMRQRALVPETGSKDMAAKWRVGWREVALAWMVAVMVVGLVVLLPRYGVEHGQPILAGPASSEPTAASRNADPDTLDPNDRDTCPNRDDDDGDC